MCLPVVWAPRTGDVPPRADSRRALLGGEGRRPPLSIRSRGRANVVACSISFGTASRHRSRPPDGSASTPSQGQHVAQQVEVRNRQADRQAEWRTRSRDPTTGGRGETCVFRGPSCRRAKNSVASALPRFSRSHRPPSPRFASRAPRADPRHQRRTYLPHLLRLGWAPLSGDRPPRTSSPSSWAEKVGEIALQSGARKKPLRAAAARFPHAGSSS